MAKYTIILIVAFAFVGCHHQPYEFENVGTTAAVPVMKTQQQAAHSTPSKQEVEKQVALAERKIKTTKKTTNKKRIVVNKPAAANDDMGTQDSPWVDVVVTQVEQPQVQESPKPSKRVPYYLTPEYQEGVHNYQHRPSK